MILRLVDLFWLAGRWLLLLLHFELFPD